MNNPAFHILVVEDESAHAAAIERSLEGMAGARVQTTGTLRGYAAAVAERAPDLVLMDMNLPDGLGLEVLPDPEGLRTFPVVLMTSYGNEEIAVQAMKSGALDYLVKSPETFAYLPHTLERLLREWGLRADRARIDRELQASERQYRTLAENIRDYIFRYDLEGRHLYLNGAALEMLGLAPAQVLGRTHAECGCPEELCEFWRLHLGTVARTRSPLQLEFAFHGRDGHTVHDVRLTPEFDGEGRVASILGVSRDITGRIRAEAERAQLQMQLQQAQKLESLGSLASGVAHDMNNVLGAILGLASANLAAHPEEGQTRQALQTIISAAQRGGELVKGLLGFARQTPAEARPVDLNGVLREEARLLERTTLSRIRLDLDLAEELRPVLGDAAALTHAFMNLCVNAVDAMAEGGTLTLRSRNREDGWAEVEVADTGTGMTPEVLARATDPFFTTKEQGKGTGLGLSMVYSTVKAHQGHLDLESEPGRGTRVRVRFPACEPEAPAAAAAEPGRAPEAARGLRVLLVDDDPLVVASVSMILEVLGHGATTATSGEDALAVLAAGLRPEVVILDMNMPGLGGAGTLPRLRELCPEAPVLLATGRTDQSALDLVAAFRGVTLLPKPFSLEELQASLQPWEGRGRT